MEIMKQHKTIQSTRRGFLTGCTVCAAGNLCLHNLPAAAQSKNAKPRIRLAFSHSPPEKITWPNIGYDYEGHKKKIIQQLTQACPDIEFLPIWIKTSAQAEKIVKEDSNIDGYIVYMAGLGGGGRQMVNLLGKNNRPVVLIDHLFAGCGNFLSTIGTVKLKKWKIIGISTSRFKDITEVVKCFKILKEPGKTAEDFYKAADSARRRALPGPGDLSCPEDQVKFNDISECIKKLNESRILVVGKNGMSRDSLAKQIYDIFGTEMIRITFPVLHEAYEKIDRKKAEQWAEGFIKKAEKIIEPTEEEVIKSGAMYLAMQELMKKHNAGAIAIHCLGGFYGGHLKAYPCLGFTEFNDKGLVGACEADLASTVTMLALGFLTGRPGFISDPVIDTSKNQIIYAHCVAPTKVFGPAGISNPYHIRSHSEDRKGACLRSLMPLNYMTTTLKFIPQSKMAILHQGKTVENIDIDRACRTKLAAEVRGDIDKLLNGWRYGWHRVTFYGDLKNPIQELCKALNIKLIEEA